MLGVQILLISAMGFLVGLEAASPSCVRSVLVATAQVTVAIKDGTYQKLLDNVELLRS